MNDMKPQVRRLTEGLYYVTEEPGDMTHYSFVVAVLPKGQTFPVSVYNVAVFPTKGDGATVASPLYAGRRFFKNYRNLFKGKGMKGQAIKISYLIDRPNQENSYTTASAMRCAIAVMEAADSKEA